MSTNFELGRWLVFEFSARPFRVTMIKQELSLAESLEYSPRALKTGFLAPKNLKQRKCRTMVANLGEPLKVQYNLRSVVVFPIFLSWNLSRKKPCSTSSSEKMCLQCFQLDAGSPWSFNSFWEYVHICTIEGSTILKRQYYLLFARRPPWRDTRASPSKKKFPSVSVYSFLNAANNRKNPLAPRVRTDKAFKRGIEPARAQINKGAN